MEPTLVILAAGMASRYGSMKQTQSFGPSGETIMDYSIFDAIRAGFKKVVLGLSGGIDSSMTAVLAVQALGKENVLGVMMPSPFSSKGSIADSKAMIKNLGIKSLLIPVSTIFSTYLRTLRPAFRGWRPDVTEENLNFYKAISAD